MNRFIQRHQDDVIGVLAGFDRLRFRGTLRSIAYCQGLNRFLNIRGIPYKDFGTFALDLSDRLKRHAEQIARQAGRPYQYVPTSRHSKEAIAREIAERDGIEEGLVCVLRIETTINNVRRFKVRRMTVWKGVRRMRWIPMRHAVADLARRVAIHRAANERYLEALAVVELPGPAYRLLDRVSRRVVKQKRPYRALRPISPEEAKAFQAVLNGGFLLKGFRNRDLRARLGPAKPANPQEARRLSGKTTRLLRLLRAHGLIRKVSGTRYYRVTRHGHRLMSAALMLREADVAKLTA